MKWTIPELVARFNASLLGSASSIVITHLCTLEDGKPGGISFFSNPKYAAAFYQTHASAVLVPKDFQPVKSVATTLIGVENPYACFCLLIEEVHQQRMAAKVGIEFPCYIGERVTVGEGMYRGAFSYIGNQVVSGTVKSKHVSMSSAPIKWRIAFPCNSTRGRQSY